MKKKYLLSLTTQGPLYPPSEVMDNEGNFVVIGMINRNIKGTTIPVWGAAIISSDSPLPEFGSLAPYSIVKELDLAELKEDRDRLLQTLPLPLPCNNYNMLFAPEQNSQANEDIRPSLPLHEAIPDYRPEHSRQNISAITLGDWVKAEGVLEVSLCNGGQDAIFDFQMTGLIPDSLYTIMALREKDLKPGEKTRPGPLGIPSAFITDEHGQGKYRRVMKNPFPADSGNRIINVVVLFMSNQSCHGGAIGVYGLGGDIHAHLKLQKPSFHEFVTHSVE